MDHVYSPALAVDEPSVAKHAQVMGGGRMARSAALMHSVVEELLEFDEEMGAGCTEQGAECAEYLWCLCARSERRDGLDRRCLAEKRHGYVQSTGCWA